MLVLILTAALLFFSLASAADLPPNELGRIMILEYHKIDYPEDRWTRTRRTSAATSRRSMRAATGW